MDMRTGGWQRIADLGEGGFGVVSLWVNRPSNKILGTKQLLNTFNFESNCCF